ncbi:hypothetical protein BGS_0320 [Beggiatoa sp. SS]|nr:hypothetical protein BGS_0320 [Beggiatoa sp. SS]
MSEVGQNLFSEGHNVPWYPRCERVKGMTWVGCGKQRGEVLGNHHDQVVNCFCSRMKLEIGRMVNSGMGCQKSGIKGYLIMLL